MATRSIRPEPGLEEVKRELQAMFESPAFCHSSRQTKLLEYLCNKVLLGEADQIKATTIAIEVFGRSWDFDEGRDAIVRVEAHRLRRKLAKYYEGGGAKSKIRIVLAPGGYVPEFIAAEPPADADAAHPILPALPEDASKPVLPEPAGSDPFTPVTALSPGTSPARRRKSVFLLAVSGLGLATLVGGVFLVRGAHTKGTNSSASRVQPVLGAVPMVSGPEVRILAGQTKTYTDRFGRTWGPDRYFTGGSAQPGPKDFYGRPPDAGLFGTMRVGEFSYDVPVPPGEYELQLYWAEPIFRLANESNGGGENERRFNVAINGKLILSSFDVVADSGISPVDVRAFRGIRPGTDGMVHVKFSNAYGSPFVNGLELIPTAPGRVVPVRIRAHDLSFTDHEGNVWSPDNYFIGGRFATHKQPVNGTPDPELYGGERYGNFNYAIPVPDGKYAVTLYFAETWFRPDSDGQDNGGKGDRIFDVYCNGSTLLKDLDVFAKAGPFRAMSHTYHGIRPNGQGKVWITFSPSKNYAAVKAIQIVEEP